MAIFLVVILALYLTICAALFFFQRALIYHPQQRSLATLVNTEKISLNGETLVMTVQLKETEKAVIYFGGNAEDVSASLPLFASAFPNHALYLMHYRGYGGSSGTPSEEALHADALALYDEVSKKRPAITVVGRSLGSGVAVKLASVRNLERLVLVTPYDSIQNIAASQFSWFPVGLLLQDKFDSWRYAPKVKAPTTVLVAQDDEVIPMESSKKLFSYFSPGIGSYHVLHSASHNSISQNAAYLRLLAGQ